MSLKLSRRSLVKVGLAGLAGLSVGFYLKAKSSVELASALGHEQGFLPNAFIHIGVNGDITFYCKNPEIGQGIQTTFVMLVAEELSVNVADITVRQAPVSYELYGRQVSAGSLSVKANYLSLRYASAAVYHVLGLAAAKLFDEENSELIRLENQHAIHLPSGKLLSYGDLAKVAASFSLPDEDALSLKSVADFKVIGRAHQGVNNRAMITGEMHYVSDIVEDDMLFANFIRPPKPGLSLSSFNETTLKNMPGIKAVRYLPDTKNSKQTLGGIAIVGNSSWQVLKARKALKVSWSESSTVPDSRVNSAKSLDRLFQHHSLKNIASRNSQEDGTPNQHRISASYSYPFLAHNTMENQVCVASYLQDDELTLRLWQNSQRPYFGVKDAAHYLGLDVEQVEAKQLVAGGGFGRRLYNDIVIQAAAIAKDFPGQTVKLFYTKEDDFINDYFRVACIHKIRCAASNANVLDAWQQTMVSLSDQNNNPVSGAHVPSNGFPYDWSKTLEIKQGLTPGNIRCGAWRSPGSNGHAFASQSALQELADAMGVDYPTYLLNLLSTAPLSASSDFDSSRAIAVIKLACEKAGWGKSLGENKGQGLAFFESHSGYFAEVVTLSVSVEKQIRIEDIVAVGDVGLVVNPLGAQAQVKSAILDALEATLFQAVEFDSFGVLTKSQADYATLSIMHTPNIRVAFIQSQNSPSGLGEPALPPLAPALCHALYNASGVRVRNLPIVQNSDFTI